MSRVSGHTLVGEGSRSNYARGNSDQASCSCGRRSAAGIGVAAARRWHAEHKAEVAAARAPAPATTDATLDALPIPDEGRVLLVLTIDDPGAGLDGHERIVAELLRIGQDVAPGRVGVAVLAGPGMTLDALSTEDLAQLGLTWAGPT